MQPKQSPPTQFQVQYDAAPPMRVSDWTVQFTPDAKTLLWRSALIDVASGQMRAITGAKIPDDIVVLAPDGKLMAAVVHGYRGFKDTEQWYGVAIIDLATATTLHTTEVPDHTIRRLFFNNTSTQLAAVSYGQIYLLDIPSGRLSKTIPNGNPRQIAFSPDGSYYARVNPWYPPRPDGVLYDEKASDFHVQVTLHHTATGQPLRTFDPVRAQVGEIVFSSDGRYLLTDAHPTPLVFDVAAGTPLKLPAIEMKLDMRKPLVNGRYVLLYDDRRNAFLDLLTGSVIPVLMPKEPTDLNYSHIRGISLDGTTVAVEIYEQGPGTGLRVGRLIPIPSNKP